MEIIYTYYKNSNTGEIIMKQQFRNTSLKLPDYFYDWNKKSIDTPDLTGFVEISEKKFNKESKLKEKQGLLSKLTKEDLIKVVANMHDTIQHWNDGWGLSKEDAENLNKIGLACSNECVEKDDWTLPKM